MTTKYPILVVHGGAGTVPEERRSIAQEGVKEALHGGWQILNQKGSALDAVQEAVRIMEDNPNFNAGKGAVLTSNNRIEMDAMLMDGKSHLKLTSSAINILEDRKEVWLRMDNLKSKTVSRSKSKTKKIKISKPKTSLKKARTTPFIQSSDKEMSMFESLKIFSAN